MKQYQQLVAMQAREPNTCQVNDMSRSLHSSKGTYKGDYIGGLRQGLLRGC